MALAGAALLALAFPKRRNLLVMSADGKLEITKGCAVFSPGIFDSEERFETAARHTYEIQKNGPIALYDTPAGSLWYPPGSPAQGAPRIPWIPLDQSSYVSTPVENSP